MKKNKNIFSLSKSKHNNSDLMQKQYLPSMNFTRPRIVFACATTMTLCPLSISFEIFSFHIGVVRSIQSNSDSVSGI